ncbi:hypothetical protein BOTCAL_1005g00010 [Botryotinia calthae]|uniref:Intradiol ring-cleavage dioxygenases domain-containing protein n=1 Tax=Botryotinia calthae TaxID=38488 RepID=A0A4Y8CE87_9HELO|nr:hypothetical protein BOTCAL_1005g00010 [Botryotinia calthae]
MKVQYLSVLGLLATPLLAHQEVSAEMQKRSADLSKRCASGTASYNKRRYERRNAEALAKRSGNTTYTITTEAPYYDVLQNDTCVLGADVTVGPYYWPRSETLRQDMTEDQVGIPLTLDVGLIDMATCEPLPNALVAFWHCNSTGSYSSFTGQSPNIPFPTLLKELNVTNFVYGVTDIHTDDSTWLRGMWPSNDDGMLEMKTIFPGFYVQRAIHIHVQVFTDYVLSSNGTIKTGNSNSIGQLYFDEDVIETILAEEPYASHTEITRLTNAEDNYYPGGFANGYNPVVSIVPADGEDITKGMIGYITIGIDTTADPVLNPPRNHN